MIAINRKTLEGYSFIDLFSGIGGFHLAMNSFGAKCVFASEWDKYAAEVYAENFRLLPHGDITQISEESIPKHDILCAGFPCQAFSIAGKQKGFYDTRGTLFFDIARIVNYHQPKILFLENVKNLLKHDNGNTFKVIKETLFELNYNVFYKVLNASDYGLPQNRERIYIVAFHKSIKCEEFKFPEKINKAISLNDILEENPSDAKIIERDDIDIYKNHYAKISLFDEIILENKPIQIGKVNKGGQGERIYHPDGHAITLSAYGGGAGAKTGLYLVNDKVRKLSPRECARVQGFPEYFKLHNNVNQAYKQFGNSVAVNVLQSILINVSEILEKENIESKTKEKIYG